MRLTGMFCFTAENNAPPFSLSESRGTAKIKRSHQSVLRGHAVRLGKGEMTFTVVRGVHADARWSGHGEGQDCGDRQEQRLRREAAGSDGCVLP